jgi:polysaccharide pyruvyl transferase WcaK-like protein
MLGLGHQLLVCPIQMTYRFAPKPRSLMDFDDPRFVKTSLKQNPRLFEAIGRADTVIINGEGTLHGLTPVSATLLFIAYAAKKYFKKPVGIINHSAYPSDESSPKAAIAFEVYKAVYRQLDFIGIRESVSHSLMGRAGVHAELTFDCLPITITESYTPKAAKRKTVVVSGSVVVQGSSLDGFVAFLKGLQERGYELEALVGAKEFPAADDKDLIEKLFTSGLIDCGVHHALSLNEWLERIESAEVFISGRFHHTIAAAYLGTPFILLNSNTPKNYALAREFNVDLPEPFDDPAVAMRLQRLFDRGGSKVSEEILERLLGLSERNFMMLRG